jgi:hypothetical protein
MSFDANGKQFDHSKLKVQPFNGKTWKISKTPIKLCGVVKKRFNVTLCVLTL